MEGGKDSVKVGVRSLEEVEEFLEHAKLKSSELLPERQILYFGDTVHDYKLLELNSEVLAAFKEGQNVTFRGMDGKKAVLCTDDRTFEVLKAETSNSSLLVPDLNVSPSDDSSCEVCLRERTIEGVFYSYYELRQIKQILVYDLLSVLDGCLYSGQENEPDEGEPLPRLYSLEELLNICQCSIREMKDVLKSIGACDINGYWRLLSFDYHLRVFMQLLKLVDSNSWPIDKVPEAETLEALSDIFPEVIVNHIFSLYLAPTYERGDDGEALYAYNEDKVCAFLAEALLRDNNGSDYDLEHFIEAWRSSVPEGMNADLKQLSGLAVIVENNATNLPQIRLCSEKDLPKRIPDRIEQLLIIKQKWTIEELTPYIKPLIPEKVTVKSTIMKYMHESSERGVKCYSSKH